jgi:hypothetical protein
LLFANFAEAVAEGRGKAQAATLHKARTDTRAKRLFDPYGKSGMKDVVEGVSALDLKTGSVVLAEPGGVVLVEPGDLIPSDGDVTEGIASIDESANPHPISYRRTSLRGKFPANREKLLRENLSDRTQQNQLVRGNFIRTGNLSLDDLPRPSRAARALCPSQNRGKEFLQKGH